MSSGDWALPLNPNSRTFSALTSPVSTLDLAGQVPELTVAGCYAPPRCIKLYENLLEMVRAKRQQFALGSVSRSATPTTPRQGIGTRVIYAHVGAQFEIASCCLV